MSTTGRVRAEDFLLMKNCGLITADLPLLYALIHRSAQKVNSPKFAGTEF
jgi:hypothetical protein